MIRATFIWLTTGETGTILEWTKPNVHLTPYHMNVIKNAGFMEFDIEPKAVVCKIEVDGQLIAIYQFVRIGNEIQTIISDAKTNLWQVKHYNAARCL